MRITAFRNKTIRACFIIGLIVFLAGCKAFTSPLDLPVIEEKLNSQWLKPAKVGTLSLTPERRVVLVNFANNRFCAEAPSESGLDLTQLRRIAASAKSSDKLEGGVDALLAGARNNTSLNKRTQGMQLYLASAYFFCQMYMNDAIEGGKLIDLQIKLIDKVENIISKEIELMYVYGANEPVKNESAQLEEIIAGLAKLGLTAGVQSANSGANRQVETASPVTPIVTPSENNE